MRFAIGQTCEKSGIEFPGERALGLPEFPDSPGHACCNMARMLHSIPRRRVVAGMAAFGLWGLAPRLPAAESGASKSPARPLADRLAAYADRLRYADPDAPTLARAKSHFIDTLRCRIPPFGEPPARHRAG